MRISRWKLSPMLALTFLLSSSAVSLFAQPSGNQVGVFEGQTDVGDVKPAGLMKVDGASGQYSISSAGDNMWSTTDSFHFAWKKMSGDVGLTADIRFPENGRDANPHRKAVLMFRQTLDANSAYVDAALHGSGMTALQYRTTAGATTQDIELVGSTPVKLRIEKRGDTFTMFVAGQGQALHQVGASTKLHLDGDFYAGIGVCSHDTKLVERAVFANLTLEALKPLAASAGKLYSTLQTVGIEDNFRRAMVVYTVQGHAEAPNWTRDGKNLFFDQDGRIMHIAAEGGTPEALNIGAATHCNGSHGISPDQKSLAISCSMPGKPESRVYIVPIEGGEPRVVTQNPNSYFHTWSPDGRTIIFTRPSHGGGNIFAIPVEGGEERALTTGNGISDDPDYSPDGKFIYFNSDRGGSMQIWRMGPDGNDPEQMTFDEMVNWTPHNSPDGKSIVFISYQKGTTGHPVNRDIALRVMEVDAHSAGYKKIRTIVNIVGGSGTMNVSSWGPDSKHFAFVSYEMLPDAGSF